MTFQIDTIAASFVDMLTDGGTWTIGDGKAPDARPETAPYAIVTFVPGGTSSGGMNDNMSMASLIFQVKIVGYTIEQCRKFQQALHQIIATDWPSISGIMGPPRVVPGGTVSDDQRTFNVDDTVYMEVN